MIDGIYERLARNGYSKTKIRKALPNWWNDEILLAQNGQMSFCMRLSRKLDLDFLSLVSVACNGGTNLYKNSEVENA